LSTTLPRISLVTPSFQQVGFIERTLRSVLDQGYPHLEYIVLDGGSTDGTVEILRKYESQLAYWHSKKDAGQSAAINEGLRIAKGEILGWLNSDDTLAPDALWRIGERYAREHDVDLIYGHTWVIDEHDRTLRRLISIPTNADELTLYTPNLFSQPGTTWRRRLHDRIGYLDESLHYVMDCDFWIRAARGGKMRCVPVHLGNLRVHGATKTSNQAAMRTEMAQMLARYRERSPTPLSEQMFWLRRRLRILREPRNWAYRMGVGS
jgi:glycosyltransferase involved in cell wall biosynthesis